ncbi:hypothetical protein F0P96_15815 [Hymenobacter busanensis]|uniref:Uncharacterized protein n=1 Tax=Hymenobacter busanensis TaxID=2607656 RepID=A0A7L4ZTF1_9BACT|nr:hypothetical protein [Hymenobacter busanensis]KAA9327450.1 hypothetical protein F0P96_15815 [Hymenobacter busanensis]QHJ06213.1 hypothetical protein GUY19_02425 [Hymenobacter busanensis]
MKKFFTLFALVVLSTQVLVAQNFPGAERKRHFRPQKDEESPYVLNVTKNTDDDSKANGTMTRLAYQPHELLLTIVNEQRKMNSWADSTYQRKLAAVPEGGALQVTMYRVGAKNADPSLLTVSARTKDGKEIFSQQLTPGTGRFWNRDQYMSQRTIPFVKVDPSEPIEVTVTDATLKQKFEYIITTK